ncbi:hypothetical protein CDAR_306941, partial [Caerostris darwini]
IALAVLLVIQYASAFGLGGGLGGGFGGGYGMGETEITPSPKAHVTDDRCRESNPNPARRIPGSAAVHKCRRS